MSVQSEINRLATAKTAIGTAIAGKGVAVPSGTKLDGMAALIDGIEAGGEDVSAETAEYTSLLTDLETAIDALPDAGSGGGSGGSVETCTVTIEYHYTDGMQQICYIDGSGTPMSVVLDGSGETSIIVQKNSFIVAAFVNAAGCYEGVEFYTGIGASQLLFCRGNGWVYIE